MQPKKSSLFFFKIFFFSILSGAFLANFSNGLEGTIYEPLKKSQIFLPIQYPQEELQRSLNEIFRGQLKDVVFVDDSFTNNNNDNLKIKSVQTGDIKVTIAEGEVKTVIPIHTDAVFSFKKTISINLFFIKRDFDLNLEKKLDFDMIVTFTTTVEQNEDLTINPTTKWEFNYETIPFVNFFFLNISVSRQVEPIINNVLEDYAKNKIDQVVAESINLSKIINDINNSLIAPILLNERYSLYGYFEIINARVGKFILADGGINLNLILEVYPYFSFSEKTLAPLVTKSKKKILEKITTEAEFTNNDFFLNPVILLTPRDFQNIIFNQISRKTYSFGQDNFAMKLNEIYSSKNSNTFQFDVFLRGKTKQSIIQRLLLIINTSFYFNEFTKKIELINFSYKVDTKSVIFQVANYFNQKNFEARLKKLIEAELDVSLAEIKQLLQSELKEINITDKSLLNLNIRAINIDELDIIDEALVVYFEATGNSLLNLRNLFP